MILLGLELRENPQLVQKKTGNHPLAEEVFSNLKDLRSLVKLYVEEKGFLKIYRAHIESLESLLCFCAPASYWEKRNKILGFLKDDYFSPGSLSVKDSELKNIMGSFPALIILDNIEHRRLYFELLLVWQRLIVSKLVKLSNVLPDDNMVVSVGGRLA